MCANGGDVDAMSISGATPESSAGSRTKRSADVTGRRRLASIARLVVPVQSS